MAYSKSIRNAKGKRNCRNEITEHLIVPVLERIDLCRLPGEGLRGSDGPGTAAPREGAVEGRLGVKKKRAGAVRVGS
jgi:hypothetical protein